MFFKEFKSIVKEKMVIKYMTDDLKISSDDTDKENSGEED